LYSKIPITSFNLERLYVTITMLLNYWNSLNSILILKCTKYYNTYHMVVRSLYNFDIWVASARCKWSIGNKTYSKPILCYNDYLCTYNTLTVNNLYTILNLINGNTHPFINNITIQITQIYLFIFNNMKVIIPHYTLLVILMSRYV